MANEEIKNIVELRKKIGKAAADMEKEAISRPLGAEMVNAYGKMINTVKVELEYAKLRKEEPDIEFMKINN